MDLRATKRRRHEATKGNARGRFSTSSLRRSVAPSLPAFTLTEILIVISLIVLMLALALPAFNFITGGRSTDAAQNQIAAFLARARTEAIGLQELRGIMFFIDPKTPDRVSVAIVHESPFKNGDVTDPPVVYLDIPADSDFLQLPKGVGVQLVDDYGLDGSGNPKNDRYIGFNTHNALSGANPDIKYGGVVLFDGNGLLVSKAYAFRTFYPGQYTAMGRLLFNISPSTTYGSVTIKDVLPVSSSPDVTLMPRSQFGMVVFDMQGAFNTQFGDVNSWGSDSQIAGGNYTSDAGEQAEEKWLDNNATSILINRYNGTLVKGD